MKERGFDGYPNIKEAEQGERWGRVS